MESDKLGSDRFGMLCIRLFQPVFRAFGSGSDGWNFGMLCIRLFCYRNSTLWDSRPAENAQILICTARGTRLVNLEEAT